MKGMELMKKLSVIIAFLMLTALLVVDVSAATGFDSGKCGDNLTYTYSNGRLTISGTGAMWDYSSDDPAPWYSYRTSLKTLQLNGGIETIGKYAFRACGFTGSLTIPSSVKTIKEDAFHGCSGFTGSLTIPSNVTTIEDYAFYGCRGFTGSLTIGSGTTLVEGSSFSGCTGITDFAVVSGNQAYLAYNGVLYTADGKELAAFPAGKTELPAFHPNCEKIGFYAFYGCSKLTGTLTIPDGVKEIDLGAFNGCSGLTGTPSLPSSLTTIGLEAFHGCRGLTGDLIIPSGVKTIGSYAFSGCTGITAAYFYGNAPSASNNSFGSRGDDFVIYYLEGKSGWTNPWNDYRTEAFGAAQEIGLTEQSAYRIVTDEVDGTKTVEGVGERTDLSTFLSNFANGNLTVYDPDGEALSEDDPGYIGTGFKLKALTSSGEAADELTVVIVGEINGDGEINATDRMILARYLAGWEGYEDRIRNKKAADIDGNGALEASDRMVLARYLAGWEGYGRYFDQ